VEFALIDRDEPRFAEASREMRERGDYIVPYFNNQFRFDKPPLTYWLQIASYRIFGENDFAARFPTAVAAALVALVLFAWANECATSGPAGGRRSFSRCRCKRSFTRKRLWRICGWFYLSHWRIGRDGNCWISIPNAQRRMPNIE
jgi:hypothetical protein